MIDRFDAMHTYNLCLKFSMNQWNERKKEKNQQGSLFFNRVIVITVYLCKYYPWNWHRHTKSLLSLSSSSSSARQPTHSHFVKAIQLAIISEIVNILSIRAPSEHQFVWRIDPKRQVCYKYRKNDCIEFWNLFIYNIDFGVFFKSHSFEKEKKNPICQRIYRINWSSYIILTIWRDNKSRINIEK